ncbi:N-6-adenine-methyltransferase [Bacteroidia bacterium]|uniref:DNA N-6-adenine-methyltransferase n=1 Tax=Dysgonomonas termitidis TaxID=1516126 RepID=A0ABV9KSG3_9BACT|nr:N-6-adenine-methyltransferase [Bacteroidia bacterium]GHV42311.1 N-6-adenine-methyltransferase [Bacteroidia bacterium]GHV48299.1 N-6-adenine-methyltransferase [Bacteroidia bacterium]
MKTSDEWYTPAEIIQSLGEFDLDPASSPEAYRQNRSAKHFYTAEENGLEKDWHGRVWLNPPYSNPLVQQFLTKMTGHNNGIALVFAKVEAKWFHDIVLRHATAIKFLYDRVRFFRPDGTQGLQPRNGSMLIAYGTENARILSGNTLKGKFLYL